jgi:hypothetical protein
MKRLLILALAAACADEVPTNPSFQQDVAPILQANCVRCHLAGAPATTGKFRLTYSSLPFPEFSTSTGAPVRGAADYAVDIARVADHGTMHRRLFLDDEQVDTITRWQARGAERGAARPGNRAPVATIVESTTETAVIDIHDPDGDLVGGYTIENNMPTTEVTQGRNNITLAPGNRTLTLHLDDGGAEYDLELGAVP